MDFSYRQLPSLSYNYLLLRLIDAYKTHDRLVIAYDIDDTVRPYYCSSCNAIVELLKNAKEVLNPYFIVYTSNPNIDGIKEFLNEKGIPYDSINENAPFVPFNNGKLYYNLFLDDKAGLTQTSSTLNDLVQLVKKGYIKKEC